MRAFINISYFIIYLAKLQYISAKKRYLADFLGNNGTVLQIFCGAVEKSADPCYNVFMDKKADSVDKNRGMRYEAVCIAER